MDRWGGLLDKAVCCLYGPVYLGLWLQPVGALLLSSYDRAFLAATANNGRVANLKGPSTFPPEDPGALPSQLVR